MKKIFFILLTIILLATFSISCNPLSGVEKTDTDTDTDTEEVGITLRDRVGTYDDGFFGVGDTIIIGADTISIKYTINNTTTSFTIPLTEDEMKSTDKILLINDTQGAIGSVTFKFDDKEGSVNGVDNAIGIDCSIVNMDGTTHSFFVSNY